MRNASQKAVSLEGNKPSSHQDYGTWHYLRSHTYENKIMKIISGGLIVVYTKICTFQNFLLQGIHVSNRHHSPVQCIVVCIHIRCNLQLMNYDHLKSYQAAISKSIMARPGSRGGMHVCMGMSKSGCDKLLHDQSTYHMQQDIIYALMFSGLWTTH